MAVNPDAFWLGLVSLVVTFTYLDHVWHAFRKWRDALKGTFHPTNERYRSFRNFFVAIMLILLFIRVDVGAFARAYPEDSALGILQKIIAPILTFLLLTGGIVLSITWRIEEQEWPFKRREKKA